MEVWRSRLHGASRDLGRAALGQPRREPGSAVSGLGGIDQQVTAVKRRLKGLLEDLRPLFPSSGSPPSSGGGPGGGGGDLRDRVRAKALEWRERVCAEGAMQEGLLSRIVEAAEASAGGPKAAGQPGLPAGPAPDFASFKAAALDGWRKCLEEAAEEEQREAAVSKAEARRQALARRLHPPSSSSSLPLTPTPEVPHEECGEEFYTGSQAAAQLEKAREKDVAGEASTTGSEEDPKRHRHPKVEAPLQEKEQDDDDDEDGEGEDAARRKAAERLERLEAEKMRRASEEREPSPDPERMVISGLAVETDGALVLGFAKGEAERRRKEEEERRAREAAAAAQEAAERRLKEEEEERRAREAAAAVQEAAERHRKEEEERRAREAAAAEQEASERRRKEEEDEERRTSEAAAAEESASPAASPSKQREKEEKAERRAKRAEIRRAREHEREAREEAEQKAREEAEREAREEAERRSREDAEAAREAMRRLRQQEESFDAADDIIASAMMSPMKQGDGHSPPLDAPGADARDQPLRSAGDASSPGTAGFRSPSQPGDWSSPSTGFRSPSPPGEVEPSTGGAPVGRASGSALGSAALARRSPSPPLDGRTAPPLDGKLRDGMPVAAPVPPQPFRGKLTPLGMPGRQERREDPILRGRLGKSAVTNAGHLTVTKGGGGGGPRPGPPPRGPSQSTPRDLS